MLSLNSDSFLIISIGSFAPILFAVSAPSSTVSIISVTLFNMSFQEVAMIEAIWLASHTALTPPTPHSALAPSSPPSGF